MSREEALRLNPVVAPEGVTGGAVWYDYQMLSTDRVTLSFLLSAVDAGACAANYVQADALPAARTAASSASRSKIALTGETFDDPRRRWSSTPPARGPRACWPTCPAAAQGAPPPRLSRAMNVVTRKLVDDHACGGLANGRYLFMVPWRDVSMLGTSHDAHDGTADQLKVSRWDLEAFLKDAREAFPHAGLTTADVRLVHRGLLPMVSGEGSHVQLLKESQVVDHAQHGLPGLVSMFGVRYTTARHTAQQAVDAVFRVAGPRDAAALPHRGDAAPGRQHQPHGQLPEGGALSATSTASPPTRCKRIATTYGTGYDRVLQMARDVPALGAPARAQLRRDRRRNPLCGARRKWP